MKTAAIIAEYNPFHNGHKYHIEETRRFADRIVVLMSGSFVQRGEPAIFSKWQRAAAAVRNGADLVLELPTFYALSSSHDFAEGAIKILNAIGCIDFLSFGSESADIDTLKSYASSEISDFSRLVKHFQKEGLSYRAALSKASSELKIPMPQSPNDLLASDYIKALNSTESTIRPVCIKRTVPHDSDVKSNEFISASAIRDLIFSGKDVSEFMPCPSDEMPLFPEDMKKLIYLSVLNFDKKNHSVRSASDSELINAIIKTKPEADFTSYLYNIKSKRYAMSRVKRTLLHILLNSGEKLPDFEPYLRVLALNNNGASVLAEAKKTCGAKIITKLKKSDLSENSSLALDVKATDIRSVASGLGTGADFLTSPIKI